MLNFLFVDKRELFVMKLSFEELCYYQQVLILPSELKSYRAFRETGLAGKLFYVLFVWSAFRIKVSIILKMIKCKIDWFASKERPCKVFGPFAKRVGGEDELRRSCASDWARV